MVKKILNKTVLATFTAAILLLASACQKDSFEKLLSGNDYEAKYQKSFEYYEQQDFYKAQLLFEQIMSFYRGTDKVEKIYFYYAYSHYKLRKYIMAAYYFKNFTTTFPNSELSEEASFMSAYSNYMLSPSYRLDQTYTHTAIDEFQRFINTYPYSDRLEESNRLIDEMRKKLEVKNLESAELYYKLGNYQSATHAFENLLNDYPDSKDVERIRYMVVDASFKLAQNSVLEKQPERFQETIQKYTDFKERYPKSIYLKDADAIHTASVSQLKKIGR